MSMYSSPMRVILMCNKSAPRTICNFPDQVHGRMKECCVIEIEGEGDPYRNGAAIENSG